MGMTEAVQGSVVTDDMPPKMKRFLARYKSLEGRNAKRRKNAIRNSVSPKHIARMCEAQGWKCAYCQRPMRKKRHKDFCGQEATVDHVVPISRGGGNWKSNLVMACAKCNQDKDDMTGDEYRAFLDSPSKRKR